MLEEQDRRRYLILLFDGRKLPLVGSFFFLFAVSPLLDGVVSQLPAHDLARIAQLVLLSGLVMVLPSPSKVALCIVAAEAAFVAVFHWTGGRWAWIEAAHLGLMVLVGDGLRQFFSARSARLVCSISVGAVALYLCLGLAPRWMSLVMTQVPFLPHEFFPGFSNARFFGHWVTLSLPVLVAACSQVRKRKDEALLFGLAALWVSFSLASGTRGTWVSIVAMCVMLGCCGKIGRSLSYRMLGVTCAGAVLYTAMFLAAVASPSAVGSVTGRLSKADPLSGRYELWSDAIHGILKAPLSGNGPMSFATSASQLAAHPHNIVLQLCFEWGIPLTMIVVVAVCWKWGAAVRQALDRTQHMDLAVCIALFGGVVHSMVDGVLVMPNGQTWFLLYCGFMLSRTNPRLSNETSPALEMALCRGVALACAVLLWVLLQPELQDLERWEDASLAAKAGSRYLPRFWIQGGVP